MKKFISVALFAAFLVASPVYAATSQEAEKAESSKETVLNKFKDNWMISIEGGANFTFGQDDSQVKFGKRLAPVFGLNVEKWFAPAIGLRVGVDYYGFKGATRYTDAHGVGELLNASDETFYKQSFQMVYPALDVMGDLASLFCGYRDRVYSPIIYLGMGFPVAVSGDGYYATGINFGLRAGFLNRFRLSEGWAINLDIRYDGTEARIPGEMDHGSQLSALIGVTYKFKNRGWNAPSIPAPVVIAGKYTDAEGDALVAQLNDANRRIADLEQQLADLDKKYQECLANCKACEDKLNAPLATVYYNIGSSELQAKDRRVLKAIAEAMKANSGQKYVITGYADSETGTAEVNAKLRNARAERVYKTLVNYGVSESQLVKEVSEEKLDRFGSYVLDRATTITIAE